METFEIHITGSPNIIEFGKKHIIKTIAVELLKPDYTLIRTEYMTSIVKRFLDLDECKDKFVRPLVARLEDNDIKVDRIKIESPYYNHYLINSHYIETHFQTTDSKYPISKTQKKLMENEKFLGTDREYKTHRYEEFREKWAKEEIELCLVDTNINQDRDWLSLWGY